MAFVDIGKWARRSSSNNFDFYFYFYFCNNNFSSNSYNINAKANTWPGFEPDDTFNATGTANNFCANNHVGKHDFCTFDVINVYAVNG